MVPIVEEIKLKQEVKDYWDYNSRLYEQCKLGSDDECAQWKSDFREMLGYEKMQILDIGTGTGFIGILLAEMGHDVTGLDFSQKMMDFAREKVARKISIMNLSLEMQKTRNLEIILLMSQFADIFSGLFQILKKRYLNG